MHDIYVSKKNIEKVKPEPLNAFITKPSAITFRYQKADEEIILLLRQHMITNIPWLLVALLLILAPLFFLPLVSHISPRFIPLTTQSTTLFLLFYAVAVTGYILTNFLTWFYNLAIITNKAILDIDYSYILTINVGTTSISDVKDISYQKSGFLHSLFQYGSLHIKTAGDKKGFTLLHVPHPEKVTQTINKLIEKKS